MPGWPDEGRRIVQAPHLRDLLERTTKHQSRFHRVFNAGSGEGGYSPLLLSLPGVKSVMESDVNLCNRRPHEISPKQLFFGASLDAIPIADGTVDLVLCTEVLEHIEKHEQALDEITRVIVPRGWLLITVPTPPAVQDSAHAREGYTPEQLSRMLCERGLEIVETRFCMYFFFRLLLKTWPRLRFRPRLLIRTLAGFDRLCAIGPPMDLMILARARAC
jgi:SAM-dependent methyltransferase